jgi:acyl carrier protein
MQDVISRDTVLRELRSALADILHIDEGLVEPGSSLVSDLGAGSLDFLDVNYRMEQVFGVKMARHFFLEHAEELLGEGSVLDDLGRLTERGAALVRRRYGERAGDDLAGLDMDQVPELVTVDAIATTVLELLATVPATCSCGAGAWTSEDGTHIVCGACTRPAELVDGDQLIRTWLRTVELPEPGR